MTKQGIIGIYLAAGQSKRFGKSKLLPAVGNDPLGSLALATALESELDRIVVVTREADMLDWVSRELFQSYRERWFQTACPQSYLGHSYSLKCGINSAKELHAEAVVIILADQPLISVQMINQIITMYKQKQTNHVPIPFIAATYDEVPRPPILFAESMFEELLDLQGDKGARFLIRKRIIEGSLVEFTNPKPFFDVDTQEDYHTLLRSQMQVQLIPEKDI